MVCTGLWEALSGGFSLVFSLSFFLFFFFFFLSFLSFFCLAACQLMGLTGFSKCLYYRHHNYFANQFFIFSGLFVFFFLFLEKGGGLLNGEDGPPHPQATQLRNLCIFFR